MQISQNRRDFLASLSAAAAGVLGTRRSFADEPPLETTTVRLAKIPSICMAPQYIAEDLLAAEGFTDVRYVELPAAIQHTAMARGKIDFSLHFSAPLVIPIDAGDPIRVLAGVHPGCFEVFGNEHTLRITDLKGKRVGVQALGSSPHVFLSSIAAYIGGSTPPRTSTGSRLRRSGRWISSPRGRSMPSLDCRPSHSSCAPRISAT